MTKSGVDQDVDDRIVWDWTWLRRAWSGRLRYVSMGVVALLMMSLGFILLQGRDSGVQVPTVPGHARSAEQAALGYLTAVENCQAKDALAYLETVPTSTALMTDAVLAESRNQNPISNIKVHRDWQDGNKAKVRVNFQFGDLMVEEFYYLTKGDNGFWRVGGGPHYGYVVLDLQDDVARMNFTVNGAVVDPEATSLELLPGTYQIRVNETLVASDRLVLPETSYNIPYNPGVMLDPYMPTLNLTAQGEDAVREALRAELDACLQENDAATTCGLAFRENALDVSHVSPLVRSEVRWLVDSGSTDIAELPVGDPFWGEMRTGPCAAAPGIWVGWGISLFDVLGNWDPTGGVVGIEGTATLETGEEGSRHLRLEGYFVDISNPDDMVVYLRWFGGNWPYGPPGGYDGCDWNPS